MTILNTLDTF